MKKRKKQVKVEVWYDAIMSALELDGDDRYFRCGSCGGPVEASLGCAWCGTADPVKKRRCSGEVLSTKRT
jgi:hypothetical protein